MSLSGHHISTSQEQSDKDMFNGYLGQYISLSWMLMYPVNLYFNMISPLFATV